MSLTTAAPDRPASPRRGRGGALLAAVAAAALLLGVTACGSDDTNAGATSTTAAAGGGTTSTTTASDDEGGGTGTSAPPITTAEHGDLPTVELSGDEQAFVDALMELPPPEMDGEQAQCIAGHWIQAVGVDAVAAAGVTPEGIADGTSSISDVPVDRPTAEKIVDSYATCEYDIVGLVKDGFASMVQGDPTKQACLDAAVTPELARDYMIAAIMATESGGPDMGSVQAVLEPCLS